MFTIITRKDISQIAIAVWFLVLMHGALWTIIFAEIACGKRAFRVYRTICEEFVQWSDAAEAAGLKRFVAGDQQISWLRETVDLKN